MNKLRSGLLQRLLKPAIALLCSQLSLVQLFAVGPQPRLLRSSAELRPARSMQKSVPCAEALKHAPEIRVGMREAEVLELLGEPTGKAGDEWGYNFWPCAAPPQVGEQKIIGLGLVFSEGVIKEIKYATVDAIGPAPRPEKEPKQIKRDARYPAHWWTPVPAAGKPDWEILPQEAGPGEVVLSKRNELGLLSNFAATPFTFRGKRYASLEGFWQMMLYPEGADDPRAQAPGLDWKYTREQVARMTGFEAKAAGTLAEENMSKLGITWVTFEGKRFEYRPSKPGEHYSLILAATREKVRQNPEVKKVLLATGNLTLKPDHYQEPNAPAAWRYYKILTRIRTELQKQPGGGQ